MELFLNQAKHNEHFYVCICTNYAETFFDWKITVSFYIAIHYLKAIAAHQGHTLPASHFEIDRIVNPYKTINTLNLTRNAWDWYSLLYQSSRTARYDGFTDVETFMLLKRADHEMCVKSLNKFKNYTKGKGVAI